MASPSAPVHPARYLSVFLALLIGTFLLVFLTGDKRPEPKLGIDLQGGTRVTLTARTPDGSKPTRDALMQAQQIIGARVNGLGVSGSEVVIDGDNLVITVPGDDGDEARNLGQTARLYIRPVLEAIPARSADEEGGLPGMPKGAPGAPGAPGMPPGAAPGMPPGAPGMPPGAVPGMPPGAVPGMPPGAVPGAPPVSPGEAGVPPAGAPEITGEPMAPEPQPRPFPLDPEPTPSPTVTSAPALTSAPAPTSAPAEPGQQQPAEPGQQQPAEPGQQQPAPAEKPAPAEAPTAGDERQDLAKRIQAEKMLRQNDNQMIQVRALLLQSARCGQGDDVLAGNDDPALPLVTCSQDGKTAYLLAPSIISGDQIQNASFAMDPQSGGNIVEVTFKSEAADTWGKFTAAHVGTATAFTLDSQVVSAPQIQEAIPGGRTRITGNFTQDQARELANVLKYGSLPLSFEASEAQTVSATLGLTALRAGLIAGAIGLALTLVYALLYYRVLGLLTALSLALAGVMVYGILVLLGRYINYTLDLAGIAGLIIGIGTTADSFVVFFERIKDEIREGRSYRSAVPRGWVRARKTIVSGNAVTFLAAAVLYVLAVGQVKGFAFTLGLTTVLDLVVVFLVTWPLVYLTSKSVTLAKPVYNGLGVMQQIARERRALGQSGSQSKAYSTGRR